MMVSFLSAGAILSAIVGIWWWRTRHEVAAPEPFVQEVAITVEGRFSPDLISVVGGWPVRLNFYRKENSPAHDWLCLAAFGIERPLPPFTVVSVDLVPTRAGEFPFTSATRAIGGMLIVR